MEDLELTTRSFVLPVLRLPPCKCSVCVRDYDEGSGQEGKRMDAGGVGATDAVLPSSCSRPSKTSMYVDQIYVDRPRRFHWEVAYANS